MADVTEPRHSYYETEETLTLDIFDKGAKPEEISVNFESRAFTYQNAETKKLVLNPLRGEIDPEASSFTVGKFKVEVRFVKRVQGRWGSLEGEMPDVLSACAPAPIPASLTSEVPEDAAKLKPKKDWDSITTNILTSEKEKTSQEDPNVGGDATVNGFFQQLFAGADEDTKRAMMKSYVESGGTTLSTDWSKVKEGTVEVKPPQGSEWKRWG